MVVSKYASLNYGGLAKGDPIRDWSETAFKARQGGIVR
jgi:hypothetical protein